MRWIDVCTILRGVPDASSHCIKIKKKYGISMLACNKLLVGFPMAVMDGFLVLYQ